MRTYMRIFRPHEFTVSEEYKSHDIPVPRVGDIVFLIDDPYEVAEVNYTYTDDECQIDIITKDVPASWWDIDETAAECDDCDCAECEREVEPKSDNDEDDADNYYEFDSLLDDLEKMLDRIHRKFNIKLTYMRA